MLYVPLKWVAHTTYNYFDDTAFSHGRLKMVLIISYCFLNSGSKAPTIFAVCIEMSRRSY